VPLSFILLVAFFSHQRSISIVTFLALTPLTGVKQMAAQDIAGIGALLEPDKYASTPPPNSIISEG
jgi:hypothetical protein